MTRRAINALVVATALALASCGGDAGTAEQSRPSTASGRMSSGTQAPPETVTGTVTTTPTAHSDTGSLLKTSDSQFGPMLFDGSGQAIYLFDKETTSRPECYRACAAAWPPVRTEGAPRPTGHVRMQLLGTTERSDGSTQVTYAGHPLYFYAHEGKNEVLCHNVVEFGGRWLVVTPAGDAAD